ncbi:MULTISPECIES: LysR family transcriptional regulator [unclassified Pseudodesulfovibrio]|uniref:LysR family transcriptional regulator n=1 Tax=unclassified Pseudodesulfovibrio TaxID=2661612 RepID=UPI000FEC0F5E|nr:MULTISPECIES: LysR family transcriptional regulator [unclassified Pseudodesulfovibrio]MCJ2164571.1 LysR family transcriptional regulator [Pseudodesulfovibrio sp. S3-i]RWU04233.1 LysR family transcriptional regulator [Pseudodesulfovibrio sp. S3]
MELRQLRYFIAVAEELHFGRAAERCHIAQPPLSQQIKRLEEELGVTLFERTSRKVSLTDEGQMFLQVARDTLCTLESGVEKMHMMAEGLIGKLRIGFLSSGLHTDFLKGVTAFRKRYPGIQLDIREMQSSDQNLALRAGELDVGLSHYCYADHYHLDSRTFLADRYFLAVHEDHPLAQKGHAEFADIDKEPFIMFSRQHYPDAYDRAIGRYHKFGVQPRIVQEAKTHQTKLSLIAAGMGIGFVPDRMRAVLPDTVRMLPFDFQGEVHRTPLKIVWRKGEQSPALKCFLEVLADYCRDEDSEPQHQSSKIAK